MLFDSFTFARGQTAKNRFFKSAMEEQLAQRGQPSEKLIRLYDTWAKGGAGILITGNVMVAKDGRGSPKDVVITEDTDMALLQRWAQAGTQQQTLCIMQLNHAGKQSPKMLSPVPLAPSAVPLQGMDAFINPPRAVTEQEIQRLIGQFAYAATLAEQAGFSGIQIHAAHGYLINQFLSPHHNRRNDQWGGSLDNRMRFLIEIYQAVRAAVSEHFLVGLKLNSADFQRGGFDEDDSIRVLQKMSQLGIDFIEISGGNYESPAMLHTKPSTQQREAFFLDYAHKARAVSQVPLIITGGFRSQAAMHNALASGDLDFIGMARPFALQPDLPQRIYHDNYQTVNTKPIQTGISALDNKIAAILEMEWYMYQMNRIACGQQPDISTSAWKILASVLWRNGKAGLKSVRAKR